MAIVASVLLLLVGCSGSSSHSTADYEGPLVAVASGTSVIMYGLDDSGNTTELDSASLPSTGLLPEHTIFGLTKHPSEPWIYASSLNQYVEDPYVQWGNARIDVFSYNAAGNITYEGVAFSYDLESGPSCADDDWEITGQSGSCAPTTLAFSSDASRLYVDDDSDDVVQIFSIDATTGELTYIWEGSNTRINGLTVSPDDGYLYNGSNVLTITGDTAAEKVSGDGGNATEVVQNTSGDDLLATTEGNNILAVYNLSDQSAPVLIDELDLGSKGAVFQASSDDSSRFIVVGSETVTSVSFDGTTLTQDDQFVDADDTKTIMNRCVIVSPDGDYALVAWFNTGDPLNESGLTVYRIAGDGTLSVHDTVDLGALTRFVLAVPAP